MWFLSIQTLISILGSILCSDLDLMANPSALVSVMEAVEIRRKLSEMSPDAFLPDLGGLASGGMTVLRWGPDAFLPDLGTSLNNLGNIQSDLGYHEAALNSTLEAVKIRRKLAEKNPDRFLPDLAMSLNNLGNRQSDSFYWR